MKATIVTLVSLMLWVGIVSVVSGCGSTTGWGVSFNAYPVKNIDHRQTLTEREEK